MTKQIANDKSCFVYQDNCAFSQPRKWFLNWVRTYALISAIFNTITMFEHFVDKGRD